MNFIKTFFLTASVLFSLSLGFVYSVDPYDKYGINVFGLKTKAVAMARENKFNMFEYGKKDYEAFVLGSSAAHRIHTEDLEAMTGMETFNYAVQHTTPDDYLAITKHILKRAKPKMIMLQMDFYGLNKNFPTDTRFFTSPLKAYLDDEVPAKKKEGALIDPDYVTLGALSDSFKTVWVNLAGTVRHLYLEDGNYYKEKPVTDGIKITQFAYENFEIDPDRVARLKMIKKLCDQRGIKLVVWTAPYSYEHLKRIQENPKYQASLVAYKNSLKEIFGEIHDFNNDAIAAYNTNTFFRDSTHATREFFKAALPQIFK